MDDEFAELYGSAADEPVQKPAQPAANGMFISRSAWPPQPAGQWADLNHM